MQVEVTKFWRHWSQLSGPNLFVRNKWQTIKRNVSVGDMYQNALSRQFKLGTVIGANADYKGIVRDVNVRIFQSYWVPVTRLLCFSPLVVIMCLIMGLCNMSVCVVY